MRTDRNTKTRKHRAGFKDVQPRQYGITHLLFRKAFHEWEMKRFGVTFNESPNRPASEP
jgi:hypothetical protein